MGNVETARLGEILLANGLATEADIAAAVSRQNLEGGVLGENLIAMGVVTRRQLESVLCTKPKAPRSAQDIVLDGSLNPSKYRQSGKEKIS